MCFGGPSVPPDNSAQIAADQEAKRETNINTGKTNIDQAFTQFDDPYYSGITKNYEDYYNPQIDQQYNDALNKLTFQLGQQGILQSSEGNRQLGLLKQSNDTQRQSIADQGIAAATTAKQQVAQQKNNLYAQNQQAADPSLAASQAAGAAASAVSPITYSPLSNVFAGLLGQGTNALALQQGNGLIGGSGSFLPSQTNATGISGGNTSNAGSGKVVS